MDIDRSRHQIWGKYAQHPKYGRFIVWPENLLIDLDATSGQTLTATLVGEYFKLNPKKMNQLFSELGWIARRESGWHATERGLRAGAQQREEKSSGNGFVVWHEAILRNRHLRQSVVEFLGQEAQSHATDKSYSSFRQKFATKHRTLDGHYVRSTGELLIDNCLYLDGVVYAYQRPLPIEEEVTSDFICQAARSICNFGEQMKVTLPRVINKTRALYQAHGLALIEINLLRSRNWKTLCPQNCVSSALKRINECDNAHARPLQLATQFYQSAQMKSPPALNAAGQTECR